MRPHDLGWRAWAGVAITIVSLAILIYLIATDAKVGMTLWG